jgi:hypothetical protein
MRKFIVVSSVFCGVTLLACLVAPEEPGSTGAALSCASNERVFNGGCHATCGKTADCGGSGSDSCMVVAPGTSLCLASAPCAFLGNDTVCGSATGSYGDYSSYDPYWQPYDIGYSSYDTYYGATGCVGDATWQTLVPSTDPACGQPHAVNRCRSAGGSCVLVYGVTTDVADP